MEVYNVVTLYFYYSVFVKIHCFGGFLYYNLHIQVWGMKCFNAY